MKLCWGYVLKHFVGCFYTCFPPALVLRGLHVLRNWADVDKGPPGDVVFLGASPTYIGVGLVWERMALPVGVLPSRAIWLERWVKLFCEAVVGAHLQEHRRGLRGLTM